MLLLLLMVLLAVGVLLLRLLRARLPLLRGEAVDFAAVVFLVGAGCCCCVLIF